MPHYEDLSHVDCFADVKHRSSLKDASREINALTVAIKGDITTLDEHLGALESAAAAQAARSAAPKGGMAGHTAAQVATLKTKLMATTHHFHAVLKDRTSTMKQAASRHGVFGGSSRLGKPVGYSPAPPSTTTAGGQPAGEERQPLLPRPGNTSRSSAQPPPAVASAFAQVSMQALAQGRATDEYFDQRAADAQAVESMVGEIGGLFQRLAGMVAEQGDLLHRLEDDSSDALERLEAGQAQLQQHHDGVMDNRWLVAKVAGVLVTFGVFFTIFVA